MTTETTVKSLDFQLTGSTFTAPSKPGLTQASPPITLNDQDPNHYNTDILQSQNPTAILKFSLTRNTTIEWQANTYLVALVFGIQMIQPEPGAPTSWSSSLAFGPIDLLSTNTQPYGNSRLMASSYSWSDNAGALPGTAFTYLVPPPLQDPADDNWLLSVIWPNVTTSGFAKSYRKATLPALALKYRAYCYTTSYGLWYVDPELDLCPQG